MENAQITHVTSGIRHWGVLGSFLFLVSSMIYLSQFAAWSDSADDTKVFNRVQGYRRARGDMIEAYKYWSIQNRKLLESALQTCSTKAHTTTLPIVRFTSGTAFLTMSSQVTRWIVSRVDSISIDRRCGTEFADISWVQISNSFTLHAEHVISNYVINTKQIIVRQWKHLTNLNNAIFSLFH